MRCEFIWHPHWVKGHTQHNTILTRSEYNTWQGNNQRSKHGRVGICFLWRGQLRPGWPITKNDQAGTGLIQNTIPHPCYKHNTVNENMSTTGLESFTIGLPLDFTEERTGWLLVDPSVYTRWWKNAFDKSPDWWPHHSNVSFIFLSHHMFYNAWNKYLTWH